MISFALDYFGAAMKSEKNPAVKHRRIDLIARHFANHMIRFASASEPRFDDRTP